jgi:flavin reductase (DIM6/NTAB) family NADH-FMN oxidoreductase RutF
MVAGCPVTMECKVFEAVDLPSNTLFVGEIVAAYSEERYLSDGIPDVEKIQPFTLTMPDNNYWLVGGHAGKAWNIGKNFAP